MHDGLVRYCVGLTSAVFVHQRGKPRSTFAYLSCAETISGVASDGGLEDFLIRPLVNERRSKAACFWSSLPILHSTARNNWLSATVGTHFPAWEDTFYLRRCLKLKAIKSSQKWFRWHPPTRRLSNPCLETTNAVIVVWRIRNGLALVLEMSFASTAVASTGTAWGIGGWLCSCIGKDYNTSWTRFLKTLGNTVGLLERFPN